ncbi:MAG: heterodisulfide reductase-related iron-sulfur binding cluster [Thermodesulfobacteriota bacterium]
MADLDPSSPVAAIRSHCRDCRLCQRECAFLARYGTPRQIADTAAGPGGAPPELPFQCSLCGLCRAVCPLGLDPAAMFLFMRQEAAGRGYSLARYRRLLAYERRGLSRSLSYTGLPAGCDTVFFPGCSLAGSRAHQVLHLFQRLQAWHPRLGVVLDCCTKPSHDLGRQRYFQAMFGELRDFLVASGVRQVLVSCPSCLAVFRSHGTPLQVRTVYEELAAGRSFAQQPLSGTVTIQDSCVARFEPGVQAAARHLVEGLGLTVAEGRHTGERTVCCGEGGGVGCVAPALAGSWPAKRRQEAEGRKVVAYCAGCEQSLRGAVDVCHLVDLMLDPQAAMAGKTRVWRAPWTYLNRYLLKKRLERLLPVAVFREGRAQGAQQGAGCR